MERAKILLKHDNLSDNTVTDYYSLPFKFSIHHFSYTLELLQHGGGMAVVMNIYM